MMSLRLVSAPSFLQIVVAILALSFFGAEGFRSASGSVARRFAAAAARAEGVDEASAQPEIEPPTTNISHGVSAVNQERITGVLEALSDIHASLANEQREEAKNYKCYMEWCETEVQSVRRALHQSQDQNDQSTATKAELTATQTNLDHALANIQTEIQGSKNMVGQARSIREEDNDKYSEDMQLNTQSIAQVTKAIDILGTVRGQGGFLQNGILKRMQLNDPGESSYVLGIMKQLLSGLEKSKDHLETTEEDELTRYDELMETKNKQLEELDTQQIQDKQQVTATKISMVEADRLVARSSTEIQRLTADVEETISQCDAKQAGWQTRGEDRSKEMSAIREAVAYLNQSVAGFGNTTAHAEPDAPSFVQAGMIKHKSLRSASGAAAAASAFLKATGADLKLVAGGMDRQDFAGAKPAITTLLKALDKEQGEEKTMKEYCVTNIQKKEDEHITLTGDLGRLNATLDRKTAESASLIIEKEALRAEIEQRKQLLAQARDIRKQEKISYDAATKDRALALKVLKQAKNVLGRFYETEEDDATQFIQSREGKADPPETWSGSSRKGLRSQGAMAMMDKLIDDVAREKKDADLEEGEAVATFTKLQEDTRIEFDSTMNEITQKVKRRAKLQVQLGYAKETWGETEQDRVSTVDQLQSLHQECDELLSSYDARTEARQFEVNQLKDVMDILAGMAGSGQRTTAPGGGAAPGA